ncbi:CPBP family intramembrane glutamic endopeptidase [Collinsella sp. CLA-AA-H302]|uniref:CPBP family intramembrane glutamic endopeptidase n=1 Tax=Collinsella sp. CLA-AA-H302 TaxID=3136217 RepID=UPI0032BF2562
MRQVEVESEGKSEADNEGNGVPLRFAFIAPVLFGISLFAAGLATLSLGLSEDVAHTVSSLFVLAVMVWLYQSFGLGVGRVGTLGVLSAISAGILLQAVSIGIIALVSKVDTAASAAVTLPYLAQLCVIDPLAEELCFRGVSLTALERYGLPFWAANLVQAALFGAFHFNIVQSAYAFVCALVLGGLRQRSGIGSSIIAHCACNLSGLILGVVLVHFV